MVFGGKRAGLLAVVLVLAAIGLVPGSALAADCASGTTSWTGTGPTSAFDDARNWSNGAPSGSCAAEITTPGATVDLASGADVSGLTLGGSGTDTLRVLGFTDANGNPQEASLDTSGGTTIGTHGVLMLSSSGADLSNGAHPVNPGGALLVGPVSNSGLISVDPGTQGPNSADRDIQSNVTNNLSGTIDINADMNTCGCGNTHTWINNGTITTASDTTSTFTGTAAGVLFTQSTGSFVNHGRAEMAGTFTNTGGSTSGNPIEECGDLDAPGAGASSFEFDSMPDVNCTGGGGNLTGDIGPNTSILIHNNATGGTGLLVSLSGDITNNGTITMNDAGGLSPGQDQLNGGFTLTNAGTLNLSDSSAAQSTHFTAQLTNQGTINLSNDSTADFVRTFTQSAGTLKIGTGATFSANGGTSLAGGTIANAGTFTGGTLTHTGGATTGNRLQLCGGTLDASGPGTASFEIVGNSGCNGATIADSTIGSGDNVEIESGIAQIDVSAGSFTNDGTLTVDSDAQHLVQLHGTALTNDGTLNFTGTNVNMSLTNGGTTNIDAAPGVQTNLNGNLINQGTIVLADGSVLTTNHTVDNDTGGQINATGSGQLSSTGTFDQGAGTTGGSGLFPVAQCGGTLNYTGAGASTILVGCGSNLTSSLTGNVASGQALTVQSGAAQWPAGFSNAGALTLDSSTGDASVQVGGGGTLSNSGTLTTVGTGNTPHIQAGLDNTGTVDIARSTTLSGGFTQSATAVLESAVTGTGAGQFAQLSGVQDAALGGTLLMTPSSGYAASAAPGDAFPVLTYAGTRTGSFCDVASNPPLSGAKGFTADLSSAGTVNALVAAAPAADTCPAPAVTVSPPALSFGTAADPAVVGTTSPPATVTVTDSGQLPLRIGTLALTGARAARFAITTDSCGGQILQPGQSCSAALTFAPAAVGAADAQVSIPDNATDSPQTISLTGLGSAAAATLSAAALKFTATPGQTSPGQTVTVSSTGTIPLKISSVAPAGSDAGLFHVVADHCSGNEVAPGASCTFAATFAPSATGAFNARTDITDNVPGASPQSVTLNGLSAGSAEGQTLTISGHVRNGIQAGQPPVRGAAVSSCPDGAGPQSCRLVTTGADGAYALPVAPGNVTVNVSAPDASLSAGSADLTIEAGQPAVRDFLLQAPGALDGGVSFDLPSGVKTSGAPKLFWGDPFAINVPVKIPKHGLPNKTRVFTYIVGIGGNANSDSGRGFYIAQAAIFAVHYNSRGIANAVTRPVEGLINCGAAGSPCVNLAAEAGVNTGIAATSAVESSTRSRSGRVPSAIAAAHHTPVDCPAADPLGLLLKPNDSGGVDIVYTYADGTQTIIPLPQIGVPPVPANGNLVHDLFFATVVGGVNDAVGVLFPWVGAYNTIVGLANAGASINLTSNGDLAALEGEGAILSLSSVVADRLHGPFSWFVQDASAFYSAASNNLTHSQSTLQFDATPDCPSRHGDGYIDPSGIVRTTGGIPVASAKVTLSSAPSAHGKPIAIRNGSVVMSPSNRRNPDHTTLSGRFGWDTLPGFYSVGATKPGCRGATGGSPGAATPLFGVPPAQTNLVLTLRCPHLRRAATRMKLVVRNDRLGGVLLLATVRPKAGRATPARLRQLIGSVTFKAGGRVLGAISVNPARGTAAALVPAYKRAAKRYIATFSGNGVVAGSSARARG